MPRIGGSTYSRRPFRPQVEELRTAGFDYWEIDLTWKAPGEGLRREAGELAAILPMETAHLPPSTFTREAQGTFQRLIDDTMGAGVRVYNVHLQPSRRARGVPLDVRTAWLTELADAAHAREVTLTLENLDEPHALLAEVFTRIPRIRFCLDIGHASLDGDKEKPFELLDLLGDRLRLVHAHDNRQGHGEAGDLHLLFGEGTVPLESILRAVRARGYGGPVTLELFSGARDEKAGSLAKARTWLSG